MNDRRTTAPGNAPDNAFYAVRLCREQRLVITGYAQRKDTIIGLPK